MRDMHTYIISSHLATRGNNKILRTPPSPLAGLNRYFLASLVAPLPNSEQINHPSSSHIYTKSTSNHIHHHYSPSVTLTHTTHIIASTAPTLSPLDLWAYPAGGDCTAGQMVVESGWGPQAGTSAPPTSKGHGSGQTTTTTR